MEDAADLGVRAVRLHRFDARAGAGAELVRSDIELVSAADTDVIQLAPPIASDLDHVAAEHTALPVLVAAVLDALVEPASGVVLTSRDEILSEAVANDSLVGDAARRLDLPSWALGRESARRLPGRHLVLANARGPNLYHWFFDSLSRVWLVDTASPWKGCALLVDEGLAGFERATLEALTLTDRLVQVEEDQILLEEGIISTGLAYASGMRPSRMTRDFAYWVRTRYGVPRPRGRRLLVSRASASVRRILNERELAVRLEREGFEVVALEELDVKAQAGVFAEAELIVAPHGAGLTNLLFAAPGVGVVECFSAADAHDSLYRRLASLLGHHYAAVTGETGPGSYPPNGADMVIDPERLASRVAAVDAARHQES